MKVEQGVYLGLNLIMQTSRRIIKSSILAIMLLISNFAYALAYNAPPTVHVEINGKYGAFSMLEVGTRVAAVVKRYKEVLR